MPLQNSSAPGFQGLSRSCNSAVQLLSNSVFRLISADRTAGIWSRLGIHDAPHPLPNISLRADEDVDALIVASIVAVKEAA